MFRRKDTTNFLYMNVNGNQLFKPKFIISVVRLIVVYSDKILMALVASVSVRPSYESVWTKCRSCDSMVTYPSSIITYESQLHIIVIKPRRYFHALAMQHRRICNVNVCRKQHAAANDAECSYPHQGQEI